MKLLSLTLKNILENKWRSLSLGSLICCAGLLIVVSNAAFMTMKHNMEDALIHAVLGEVQVRPKEAGDDSPLIANDAEPASISSQTVKLIEQIVRTRIKTRDYTKRVVHNVLLVTDTAKSATRIIGLEPQSTAYQKTFKLSKGRYLDARRSGEMLLTEEQAKKLHVKVGEVIGLISQTRDGYNMDAALTVVGIGHFDLVSSVAVAYTDLKSARELIGFTDGEVSDLILYAAAKSQAEGVKAKLQKELARTATGPLVKLTTYRNIKSFELSGISVYIAMFYIFVTLLLLIIGILIVNLIYMIGIERRQEIGTLRAIGFSKANIMGLFAGEIVLITTGFALVGVLSGAVVILIFSKVAIVTREPLSLLIGKQFLIRFDLGLILAVLIALPGFALAAAWYPAFKAASLQPVETLKEI